MHAERTPQLLERQEAAHRMRRIVIVGTSGSGKTTLARQLGAQLNVPAVELDALYWEPDWTSATPPVLRERADAALRGDGWVVDGNYSTLRDLTWGRADTVVWLDYPVWIVMARVMRRTFTRIFAHVELWNGNRESLKKTLFSKESILLWALQTHQKNRRIYSKLTNQPEYAHLRMVRHRSPRATRQWLAEVK